MSFYAEASGRLLAMCPSQEMWRQTIADLVDKLVGEEGVNGVYVDQVSAMKADLCYAKDHGHPIGGGRYWADGNREEMRKIRNAALRQEPQRRHHVGEHRRNLLRPAGCQPRLGRAHE